MKVKLERQSIVNGLIGAVQEEYEVDSFDLKHAMNVINGDATNKQGNPIQTFMIGDDVLVRGLEVISIQVEK